MKKSKLLTISAAAIIAIMTGGWGIVHADQINGVEIVSNNGRISVLADGTEVYNDGDLWYLNGNKVEITTFSILLSHESFRFLFFAYFTTSPPFLDTLTPLNS